VGQRRVRRMDPPAEAAVPASSFACAYAIDIAGGDRRTAEQWARSAWEGAAAPMRWFIVAGWKLVLGLRLGPRSRPDHILGWRIMHVDDDRVLCHAQSWFLSASNSFQRRDGRLVWSTFVTYERGVARAIWPPVSVLHRLLVRIALSGAASAVGAAGDDDGEVDEGVDDHGRQQVSGASEDGLPEHRDGDVDGEEHEG